MKKLYNTQSCCFTQNVRTARDKWEHSTAPIPPCLYQKKCWHTKRYILCSVLCCAVQYFPHCITTISNPIFIPSYCTGVRPVPTHTLPDLTHTTACFCVRQCTLYTVLYTVYQCISVMYCTRAYRYCLCARQYVWLVYCVRLLCACGSCVRLMFAVCDIAVDVRIPQAVGALHPDDGTGSHVLGQQVGGHRSKGHDGGSPTEHGQGLGELTDLDLVTGSDQSGAILLGGESVRALNAGMHLARNQRRRMLNRQLGNEVTSTVTTAIVGTHGALASSTGAVLQAPALRSQIPRLAHSM